MSIQPRIEAPDPGLQPDQPSARIFAFPSRERALGAPLDRLAQQLAAPREAGAVLATLCRLLATPAPELRAALRAHPLQAMLLEEPLTVLARGVPSAEAEWLDLLLGTGDATTRWLPLGPAGARLHAALRESGLAVAAAERCVAFAEAVDATAAARPRAAVLSLGAGHLREAALVTRARALEIWLVLEEDSEARAEIARAHDRHRRIATAPEGIGRFLAQPTRHGRFDLITLGGLADQLDGGPLTKLVRAAFAALRPGGRLLLANTAEGLPEASYATEVMGRTLFCRDAATLGALLAGLPDCAGLNLRHSPSGGMLFAEAVRRG